MTQARLQPQYPAQIAAWHGIKPLVVFNAGATPGIPNDVSARRNGTFTSTGGVTDSAFFGGRGRKYASGGTALDYRFFTPTFNAFPIITAYHLRVDSLPGTTLVCGALGDNSVGSSGGGIYSWVGLNASNQFHGATRVASGGAAGGATGPTAAAGGIYSVVNASYSRTEHYLWVNGVEYFNNSDTGAATAEVYGVFGVGALKRNADAALIGLACTVGLAWCARSGSKTHLRMLSVNPYSLFETRRSVFIEEAVASAQPPRSMHQFRMRRAA